MMDREKIFFVSGIGTDVGKSYATGELAGRWNAQGMRTATMKFIQTGGIRGDISDDVTLHRRIMGIELLPEDRDLTTSPVVLSYPASPHLAARLDDMQIDMGTIIRSAELLAGRYDRVLIEGAGGLMVPVREDYLTADFVAEHHLPLILVTSPQLGSLNHTLLTLEACQNRGIDVAMVMYNLFPEAPGEIVDDTRNYLKRYIGQHHPRCLFTEIPILELQ